MDKKYLFVINNLSFGGAEKLVLDQINYFCRHGFSVKLLTLVNSEKPNFNNKLLLKEEDRFFIDANLNFRSWLKVFVFLKRNKFDVIFSHLFLSNTLVRLAAIFLWPRPKVVVFEHNNYEKEKKAKHLLVDKILAMFTYKIIAVSESVKAYLLRSGISKNKIALLKNGVDFSFANLSVDKIAKRQSLGLDQNEKIVVSVGNVNLQKGYDILIAAAKKILVTQPKIVFLICGNNDNDLAKKLMIELKENGLEKKIIFLGSRADVLEIVSLADIFLMPSRWEGLSIALLESMALAKALLVSDIESMRLVLKDQEDCLMFNSGNESDLVVKLSTLLANQALCNSLGEAAKIKSSQYSIENNVKNLFKIINE